MQPNLSELHPSIRPSSPKYIPVRAKFWISQAIALAWMGFSIVISLPWVYDLGQYVTHMVAVAIIAGISYIPGYLNAFMVASLLLDRQPRFKTVAPLEDITIVIACRNEEKGIGETLTRIAGQDHAGNIQVIVVDNASTDRTADVAREIGRQLGLDMLVVSERRPGKHNALNRALPLVTTRYVATLDADTLLHPSAIRYIVARMLSAPADVCAVAGAVLVRNSRKNFWTKIQEWDYFLGIASIKRLQGLYQGTLVAQGAFSLYETEAIRKIGGWPDAIGEDIVLTWRLLGTNRRVFFEPLAVAFTDVPETGKHFFRQRSRWARGMIEGLKAIKPWEHPIMFTRFLTGYNLIMPYLDIVYTFCWIPGLVAACFGYFWIVGPFTLLVLPLTILQNYILYRYQKSVFHVLGLKIRRNRSGFIAYVLCYQMLISPMSVWGYLQEWLKLRRVWK
ncbi:glycosyltransferase family 2 protein [Brevibacillus marinus]|uniref:glycosyltransferase family 2 protein n=1 Tax=Brevibacillus marinus TaxID=2496837 RepID=UPI000F82DE2E|nr:glycosyltransferase [Brevibacillus marinus]